MIRAYWLGGVAALATLASCVGPPDNRPPAPIPAPVPQPVPSPTPAPLPPATFDLAGEMEQGGAVIGTAPVGTVGLAFDGEAIPIASDGRFLIAFDRDQIGRAHVWTPVTNAHLVCRLLLEKKNKKYI